MTSSGPDSRRESARPFWIDTAEGALFAWHNAPTGSSRDAVILLCRPFGYEAQCTQRAYRHLARRLGAAGFHALRFDAHGTGDSSGGDADRGRVPAWVASIGAAAAWARASLGVRKVVLFGTRFGALLAAKAASDEAVGVDAMVLFAPPASGRTWLRETRAFQAMVVAAAGLDRDRSNEGREEAAGFLLTSSTVAEIDALGADTYSGAGCPVLLVARDDLPGPEEKIAASARARGADATLSKRAGFAAMMHPDPRHSVVPDGVWTEVTDWLSARYPAAPEGARAQTEGEPLVLPTAAAVREHERAAPVREELVDMGGLFGVLTKPIAVAASSVPSIILHNIGANSHVGANRMYVTLARRWAAHGYRVLRFDIAGLGDSPANERVEENEVYSDGTPGDSLRAMDYLARMHGARRFVLMGLCSGAYFSYHAALADERVAGIVLMNVQLFHWKKGDPVDARKRDMVKAPQYYWRAATGLDVWVRVARGQVNVSGILRGALDTGWTRLVHRLRGTNVVARGMRVLLRRGTDVLIVLSADDGARNTIDSHLGTNGSQFRREPGFRLEIIDRADHTFSFLAAQGELCALLTRHLLDRFGSHPAERPPSSPPETPADARLGDARRSLTG